MFFWEKDGETIAEFRINSDLVSQDILQQIAAHKIPVSGGTDPVNISTLVSGGYDHIILPLNLSVNSTESLDKTTYSDSFSDDFLIGSHAENPVNSPDDQAAILTDALTQSVEQLEDFANSPDLLTQMGVAFGDHFNTEVPQSLAEQWSAGLVETPPIEVISTAEINGANGAFAAATNTIYISEEFLAQNYDNVENISTVLLEEYGHYIDTLVNVTDTPGDEGAIFSGVVRGNELDELTLEQLKAEDDTVTVILDGEEILIEQDNTLSAARAITVGSTAQTYRDWAGTTDTNDYYRFSVSDPSTFSLTLNGLSADADVQLLNSSGSVIQSSINGGTTADTINRSLTAGTYYVRVYPMTGVNTYYNLSLSATPNIADNAGNTVSAARAITVGSTAQTYRDWAGTTDTNDYYRFSVSDPSTFSLTLNGLSANADVQLLNSSGSVIQSSINGGTTADTINRSLTAGTYYVRVYPMTGVNTYYNLSLSATPNIADNAGNTVSAARAITVGSTAQTYRDWAGTTDTNDYYRFSVSDPSTFSLTLNGLSANADVQLLNSSGSVIQSSTNGGTTADTINRSLTAGTYYVRVYPMTGVNTYYNLSLSATPSVNNDWFSQNIRDAGLQSVARSRFADGTLDRNDMIGIFSESKDSNIIDATELTDLRTLVSNSSRFNMPDSVRVLSNKVVNANSANQRYQGGSLGNLSAGSSSSHMENLIGKWFRGLDRPETPSPYTYQYASGSLFNNGVSYQDIYQGTIGDCYFLASLGATAYRTPSTIQSMFTDNGDNTYTVRFYNNGAADYVTVDRFLPTSGGNFIYSNLGNSINSSANELWVALAEKAYAQVNESGWLGQYRDSTNTYSGINGGLGYYAIPHITGRNTVNVYVPSGITDTNAVVNAFNAGQLITFGSKQSGVASNVVASHEYTLVGYNSSTQKFKLFNPWGVNGGLDISSGTSKPGIIELTPNQVTASFDYWASTTSNQPQYGSNNIVPPPRFLT